MLLELLVWFIPCLIIFWYPCIFSFSAHRFKSALWYRDGILHPRISPDRRISHNRWKINGKLNFSTQSQMTELVNILKVPWYPSAPKSPEGGNYHKVELSAINRELFIQKVFPRRLYARKVLFKFLLTVAGMPAKRVQNHRVTQTLWVKGQISLFFFSLTRDADHPRACFSTYPSTPLRTVFLHIPLATTF